MAISNLRIFAGGAAVAVIGILIGPAHAQALPPAPLAPIDCAGYQFPGGRVSLHYPVINAQTEFDTVAGGTHVDTTATTKYPQSSMSGTVVGDINGTNMHLVVTRQGTSREYSPLILDGQVGADNRGHGTFTYDQGSGNWDSIEALKCVPAPPPAAKPEEPKPVAAQQPVPQEAPAAQQAPAPQEAPVQQEVPIADEREAQSPDELCIPNPFGLEFPGAC